jgi:hypothetical protein
MQWRQRQPSWWVAAALCTGSFRAGAKQSFSTGLRIFRQACATPSLGTLLAVGTFGPARLARTCPRRCPRLQRQLVPALVGAPWCEGETFLSVIHKNIPDFPPLHQGGVKYRWDGEETYGMIERSYPADKMTP